MGKITKAIITGISTRRRKELKVMVLMVSHDFFKICYEFESAFQCTDQWIIDLDDMFHVIGRVTETTACAMNFHKSFIELQYVKSRIKKYLISVLEVIIDGVIRSHHSSYTHDWNHEDENNDSDYYHKLNLIVNFKKKTIKRLSLII